MALGGSLAGVARVILRVDDTDFHRDLASNQARFRQSASEMERDANRLTRGALSGSGAFRSLGRSIAFASTSFLGAAGFTALVRTSISAASDLHEEINKAAVVFRGSQKDILDWARTTAESLGIAEHEALGMASTFGNMLVPMGFARGAAEAMSKRMVELASDMASFNNASPADVLAAIQSGLAGQVRPLRQYGVAITQARIQQELMRAGVHETAKEITSAQKAWAIYQIILKDTKDAQGDFARTSGGLANQQRILRAELTDDEAQIGRDLLPSILSVTKGITGWLSQAKNQKTLQRDVNTVITDATTVFHGLRSIVETVDKVTGGFKNTLELLLGLKVASTLSGWTGALRAFVGTEAAATGVSGAAAETGVLNKRLGVLRTLASKPFQILISYAILRKIFPDSGADLSDSTSNADLVPVYRDGKWVNPITGKPVQDQAYWNKQFKRAGGSGTPLPGQQAGGSVTQAGAPPTSYANRVKSQTAGLTALQSSLPGAKGSNAISFPGHAAKSYHYSGEALDIGDGGNPAALISDWNYLYPLRQNFAELIWNPPADVQARAPGSGAGYFWGIPGKFTDHTDHIHVAFTGTAADVSKLRTAVDKANSPTAPSTPPPGDHTGDKKKKAKAVDLTQMPAGLRLEFETAVGKKDVEAEIKILNEFARLLEKRKAAAKTLAAKADITAEINDVRSRISDLRAPAAAAKQARLDSATAKTITSIQGMSDSIGKIISTAFPAGSDATQPATDFTGKQIGVDFAGVTVVQFDPKTQKWITTKVKPDVAALKKELDYITATVLPGLSKRIAAMRASIKRLSRHPKKNQAQLARMRQTLAALIAERSEIVGQATDLAQSIDDLAAALKYQPDPETVDTSGGQAPTTGDSGGDSGTSSSAADAIQQAFEARQSYLEDIPADLRLAQAQAGLTDTTVDDRAAVTAIRDLTQQRLAQAYADGNDQIEAQIVLVERLAQLNAQLNDQRAQENEQLISYLTAVRGLRAFQGNVLTSPLASLGGSTINVTNTFTQADQDPHLYSQALAFELKALVG